MANRFLHYFKQLVKPFHLNDHFDNMEAADRAQNADLGLVGIASGMGVTEASIPNLFLRVGAGAAYDKQGRRISIASTQTVDVSKDENGISTTVSTTGNSRILSLFCNFARDQSDVKSVQQEDGSTANIYYVQSEGFRLMVAAGAESVTPTAPALRSDSLLLADVTLTYGQTAVTNSAVSITRREWMFRTTSGLQIAVGTLKEALQLLADSVGALIAISDDTAPDDGASRVGMDVITQGVVSLAKGTVRSGLTGLANALNSHITTIASTTDGASGAETVGTRSPGAFATGGALAAGSVYSVLNAIVTGLGATTGSTKVGSSISAQWKDGTGIANGTLSSALNAVVSMLADSTGASKVGAAPAGNLSGVSVQAQLSELDSEKAGLATANTFTAMQTMQPAAGVIPVRGLASGSSQTPGVQGVGSAAGNTAAGGVGVQGIGGGAGDDYSSGAGVSGVGGTPITDPEQAPGAFRGGPGVIGQGGRWGGHGVVGISGALGGAGGYFQGNDSGSAIVLVPRVGDPTGGDLVNGAMWVDSSTNQLKVRLGGVTKIVTVT